MILNWPLITTLFVLSIPGTLIAIPRLIDLILPDNTQELRRRFSRFAIGQTLAMVLLMSIAGAALSLRTGLGDPLLNDMLVGHSVWNQLASLMLPVFLYSVGGLVIFLILYNLFAKRLLEQKTLIALQTMWKKFGLDGCLLYGGVVEEVLARWGLLNVITFFAMLFAQQKNDAIIYFSMIVSGIFYTLSHLPAYIAAGCQNGRRFVLVMLVLNGWQAILFSMVFWRYGILAAIISHMLFHTGWYFYDRQS